MTWLHFLHCCLSIHEEVCLIYLNHCDWKGTITSSSLIGRRGQGFLFVSEALHYIFSLHEEGFHGRQIERLAGLSHTGVLNVYQRWTRLLHCIFKSIRRGIARGLL